MVLDLLDWHPFSSFPCCALHHRRAAPLGWISQPPVSDLYQKVRGQEKARGRKPGDSFPLPSLPWPHLFFISYQGRLPRSHLPWQPWSWGSAHTDSSLCPLLLLSLVTPRLPFLICLFSFPITCENNSLNYISLTYSLACVLLVRPWQSFHLNAKSLLEWVTLDEQQSKPTPQVTSFSEFSFSTNTCFKSYLLI